jgi:hypothetical protein
MVDLWDEIYSTFDAYDAFEFVDADETIKGLARLVDAQAPFYFAPFSKDPDAIVVIPVNIQFYKEWPIPSEGHGLMIVMTMSEKTKRLKAVLMDGNGYIPEWHNGILWMISKLGGSVDSTTTDETTIYVNFPDTKSNSLAKLGITHQGKISGYCAFLQWILLVNIACVGKRALHKGHINRLIFHDLLHVQNPSSEGLEPWQEMVIKSFLHACSLKILRIISEDYPSENARRSLGWPDAIPFPNVSTIKTVRVRRVEKHGTVILEKIERERERGYRSRLRNKPLETQR